MTDPLCFPQDEGYPPGAQTEWWCVSGHRLAPGGTRLHFYAALSTMPSVMEVKANPDHYRPPLFLPPIMGSPCGTAGSPWFAPGRFQTTCLSGSCARNW